MTAEEARDRTVAGKLALARECLAEAKYALQGGFYRLARLPFQRHTGLQAAV
jgi:hypothetical protein